MRLWLDSDPPCEHLACDTPVTDTPITLTRRAARSTRQRITGPCPSLTLSLHGTAQEWKTSTESKLDQI